MNEWIDADARAERAHDLYEEGRLAEAAAELRAAIELNPYNPSWRFNLGLTLEAMEDYSRACEAFADALTINPDDVETHNCLGVNLTRMDRCAEALEHFARAEQLDPTFEPLYCNRIVTYTRRGDHDNAEVMFYLARQISDECPWCFYNLGISLKARGLYGKARYCFEQTLRLDPDHAQVHARLAEIYWSTARTDLARNHYELEIAQGDDEIDVLLDYGELLLDLRDYARSEEIFRRALTVSPEHAATHFCLGELALERGDLVKAAEQFKLVTRIDGAYPGAHAKLAKVYITQKELQQAGRHLVLELKVSGEDPALLEEVGHLLIQAQQTRTANCVLRRLVEIEPENATALLNLAVSHFMLEELDEGIRRCRRALKYRPDYPLALYNLALAHLQKGQADRARRYVARAVELKPDDPQIRKLARDLGRPSFWRRLRKRLTRRGDRDAR